MLSFVLLGLACALAALCYAELASMIPQAGSAYAYSYATLGELVAWIIGWDLILEYAVGNVAVAISWGDYFNTLLRGFNLSIPAWLTTGYRTALLSSDPAVHGLLQTAPHVAGIPIVVHVPAFGIVMLITWLLLRGARESVVGQQHHGGDQAAGARPVHRGGRHAPQRRQLPSRSRRTASRGIHQGAAIVFFAYIGFDAISTAAEETKNPQRNLPIGILGGLAICTLIYVVVGFVLTGMVPYQQLAVADPLARALQLAGFEAVGWIVALGAAVSMSAVLLVFQYGQPRIFYRHGPRRAAAAVGGEAAPEDQGAVRHDAVHRDLRGAVVADRRRRRNLRPDQHRHPVRLHAGQHRRAGPARTRIRTARGHSACRFVWPVCLGSAAGCLFIMQGLPRSAWERFGLWLLLGLALYFVYGFKHSKLRNGVIN